MVVAHKIEAIEFSQSHMSIKIDGYEINIPYEKLSNKLESASDVERMIYRLSPSGYGIHWPLLDEDLSIDALLRDFGNLNQK